MVASTSAVSKPSSCVAAQYADGRSTARYRQRAVAYLDGVAAQVAALKAKRSMWQLQTRQLSANVTLIKVLGGGWDVAPLAASNPIN
ncbi:hypothetical protein [Pseudomonas sp. 1152_12]|uniref:hypothetical protein n=1 Tax=Pseudomonas sp. 1152_12 TaxID=2604455 RepID=UPI004063944F